MNAVRRARLPALTAVALVLGAWPRATRAGGDPCLNAAAQSELTACACDKYHEADGEMNVVYKKVIARHSGERLFIQNLRKAQRAWVAFRDAEIAAIWPVAEGDPHPWGSVWPMCECTELQAITQERTRQLREWLATGVEGDVCEGTRGSVE